MNKKLRVVELFAGVGTQVMALKRLAKDYEDFDYEVIGISEIDKFAVKSYNAIHGETRNFGDVTLINPSEMPDFDLLTYSFPCQDISSAGRQRGFAKGSSTRSGLLWECEKIIEAKRPKYLLMENVKNLVSKKFMPHFEEWIEALNKLGYTSYFACLNSKDYGVPQHRERIFMVSILGEHKPYEFPKGFELDKRLKDVLEDKVDESFYLTQARHEIFKQTFNGNVIKNSNKINILGYVFPSNYGASQVLSTNGISCTVMYGNGAGIKILDPNTISLVQKDNYSTLEDGFRLRRLSDLEMWRLMGISDEDFYKAKNAGVSKTQLCKQAGNAIVVDVLYYIFKEMFNLDTQK